MSEGAQGVGAGGRRPSRARVALAAAIIVASGAAGALAGWASGRPMYKSRGLIHVAPKPPTIVTEPGSSGLAPMHFQFTASQEQLLTTRRVIDMAMASQEWQQLRRERSDEATSRFHASLAVSRPGAGDVLEVSFVDASPMAAMTAVNQVVGAFMKIVSERDDGVGATTLAALETRKGGLNNKLSELRARTLSVSDGLGARAVDERYESSVAEIVKLDAALHEFDLEIAKSREEGEGASSATERALTQEDMALRDAQSASLLAERESAERRLAALRASGDLGDRHPQVVLAVEEIETLTARIAERVQAFGALQVAQRREKVAQRARVGALRDELVAEAKSLEKRRFELANLEDERRNLSEQLAAVKKRLEEVDLVSAVQGRTSVLSLAERPARPDSDSRITFAVLGAIGGLAVASAIVTASRSRAVAVA